MKNELSKKELEVYKEQSKFVSKHIKKLKFTDIPLIREIIFHNSEGILTKHSVKKPLSAQQSYVYNLNNSITALQENFRDIELIEIFLWDRLKDKAISKKGVTDPEYIRYHMENYFIRIHKIKDQVCILIKNYFKLNYKENNWLEKNLLSDEFLKTTLFPVYIRYCQESFSKLRPVRNQIAHKSNLESSDLGVLQAILLHPRITPKWRSIYLEAKEIQIMGFVLLSERNRKILYETIVGMLVILNEAHIPDYERHSGRQVKGQKKLNTDIK